MALLSSLLGTIEERSLPIMVSSLVWATCLLGLAWMTARLWRRSSAGVRYCIWQFALIGLLAVPALFLALPGVPLGFTLEPAAAATEEESVAESREIRTADASDLVRSPLGQQPIAHEQENPWTFALPVEGQRSAAPSLASAPSAPVVVVPADSPTTVMAPPVNDGISLRALLLRIIAGTWVLGIVVQGLWLLRCILRAETLARGATAIHDARFEQALQELVPTAAARSRVRLGISPQVRVPVVVGIWQPRILCPADCTSWSQEKIRLVLSHELAHVERRDIVWQLAARMAATMYWVHPMAWLALRRMREERERACDDRVLAMGVAAIDYATGLVEVAAALAGRPARLVAGIGMAERSELADRVNWILDRTSRRHPASARFRRGLLVTTAVLVVMLGVLRPFSPIVSDADEAPAVAQSEKESEKRTNEAAAAEDGGQATKTTEQSTTVEAEKKEATRPVPAPPTREKVATTKEKMLIRVVDSEGKPIARANIHTSVWTDERDFRSNHDYTCDEQGQAEVALPKTLSILRLWSSKAGYVPLFVNWDAKREVDGHLIPDEFTFHMQPGTSLGGVIKNEQGQPIEGARVDVKYERGGIKEHPESRAVFDTWLSNGATAIRSDAQGRWTLRNAPAGDDLEIRIKLRHPNYVSDPNWSEPTVSMKQLRDQTAEMVMQGGLQLTGTITDPDGKPVAGALAIWGDRPYWEHRPQQEVRTDDEGVFHFPPLPSGKLRVTIVAKGWMPEMRFVDIGPGMSPLDMQLKPGKTLRVRLVDVAGKPIPEALFQIVGWRGVESLYNYNHPNVLDSRIPRNVSKDGIYEWTWAPDDDVSFRISAIGDYAAADAKFAADDAEQEFVLQPKLHFRGRVVDAETGQPILKFTMVPMISFRPDFPLVERDEAETFDEGRFDFRPDRTDVKHSLQIEAPGYATARLGWYSVGDEVAEQNIRLTAAPHYVGRVVTDDGRPVPGARVYVGSYSQHLYLQDLDEETGGRPSNYFVTTDAQGNFEIAHQLERYSLVLVSPECYGEAERTADQVPGEIKMRRWAKVRGRLLQAGQAIPKWDVRLDPIREQGGDAPRGHFVLHVKTSDDGSFEFGHVPPVPCHVEGSIHWSSEGPLSSSRSLPLHPAPGESISVSLGEGGTEISGQLALDPAAPAGFDYHFGLNYLVARRPGITPPPAIAAYGFDGNQGWNDAWTNSLEGTAFLNTLDHFYVKPDPDGQFRISGVPPGEYDLAFKLYGSTEGCLTHPVGQLVQRVSVPKGEAKLDLGTVKVPALQALKVGDPAPDVEFVMMDGTKQKLAELHGKYVLIDFWASWCGVCVSRMGEVEKLRESLMSRPELIVIGANLDHDSARAKEFLSAHKLPWKHALLGDWSSTDIPKRFAVSSIPTYVLIAPDGRVAANSFSLDDVRKELSEVIAATGKFDGEVNSTEFLRRAE